MYHAHRDTDQSASDGSLKLSDGSHKLAARGTSERNVDANDEEWRTRGAYCINDGRRHRYLRNGDIETCDGDTCIVEGPGD